MSPEDERRLVRKARKDPEAFAQLYDIYFDRILAYCLQRLGSLPDAEDATAETFIKAMHGIGRFRWRGGGFLPWLYRVAHNEVMNIFRRRKKGEQRTALESAGELAGEVRDELVEQERRVQKNQLLQDLFRCLEALKPREQEILTLRHLQGESYSLIAQTTAMREGTVRVTAMRSLQKLEKLLLRKGWNHESVDEARAALEAASDPEISGLVTGTLAARA